MNKCFVIAILLADFILPFNAQAATRAEVIVKIEGDYLASVVIQPDSPFIAMMLAQARAANRGAPVIEWQQVQVDTAAAVSKAMATPGGPLDMAMQTSLKTLSDAELLQLSDLLSNPIYRKFQRACQSVEAQKQLMAALVQSSLQMPEVINQVLKQHGMQEVP